MRSSRLLCGSIATKHLELRIPALLPLGVREADPADVLAGETQLIDDLALPHSPAGDGLTDCFEQLDPLGIQRLLGALVGSEGGGKLRVGHVTSFADPKVAYIG